MTLSPTTIVSLAEHLDGAERHVRAVPMLTDAHGAFGLDDAYAIQHALRRRKQADGARIVGLKMGLTSRAKMLQVRVDTPIYGFLTAASSCADRARLQTDSLIHPRVEPEIAFSLKAPLRGPGCTIGSVLRATDFVAPALEVIDSRYRDFRFDLPSVVADNASCARHVLGGRVRHVGDVDLRTIGVVLERNGEIVATGAGAAVLGHPAAAVAMLVDLLAARGEGLDAGMLVLSGALTEAVNVSAGDAVTGRFQDLGTVSVSFT